jgi:hypothetical protein
MQQLFSINLTMHVLPLDRYTVCRLVKFHGFYLSVVANSGNSFNVHLVILKTSIYLYCAMRIIIEKQQNSVDE